MKLFGKIFLRVMIGILVLTQVIFIWFLSESRNQNLNAVHHYERAAVSRRTAEMRTELNKAHTICEKEEMQNTAAISAFREIFMSSGALYRNGMELYNASPYKFNYELLKKRHETDMHCSIPKIADYVEITNGKKLLLYTNIINFGTDYFFCVTYKDVTDIYLRTKELFLKGCYFTLFLLLIIGSGLFFSIYRTIAPLTELKKAATSIAEGDYQKRISVSKGSFRFIKTPKGGITEERMIEKYEKNDEIAALAVSFNRMAEKVQEHTEKLMQTNEMQRQLLGSLAHELKTPMTAIIGYADTLLTVRLSDKRREQALTYIEKECRRLSKLSVKMLELTGLYETGEKTAEFREITAADLLEKLKNLMKFCLKPKGIRLETMCNPENLILWADEDLIMSLLMNLVDNAYKASPENSVIFVSAETQGIYVSDCGKGIPLEEIRHVTEAFYMIDKSRSRNTGSVGLGLTLCKKIAELHGAVLGIESEEGVGTTVSLVWHDSRQPDAALQSDYNSGKI